MEKIWLKEYPDAVPAEVNFDQYRSLRDTLEASCERFSERPAFSNLGTVLTYDDVDRLSRDFGAYLQTELGLKKGDRVAIMSPNLLQYPIALFGILRAGLVVVNVNPLYTARELEHQLMDSGATAIIIVENFAGTLEKVLARVPIKTVITTRIGDMHRFPKSLVVNFVVKHIKRMVPPWFIPETITMKRALELGRQHELELVELDHDDVAFLQYTGGTTGVAKGAVLTHGNMVANLQQASTWIATVVSEEPPVTIITALPLYHIFSLTANCLTFMKIGGHNVLITNPRDMPGFVKELGKVRFHAMTGVNTLFNGLLNTPGFDELDFSGLKLTLGGGMAVQEAVAERWKAVTKCTLIEAYGLTETSPAACINPMDLKQFNHSIGLPISSTEVSIRDDDFNEVPLGEMGELCIRGPQVMRGYWNRPDETAKQLTSDGWLRTGDLGYMDEKGYCRILERKNDMIVVSGFNVYPNEIEDVCAKHPGVLEVAAVGVPNEKSGELVKLVVVRKDPNLTEEQVIRHCRESLTAYKVPKKVEFRDELPKTNVGKILRRALRDEQA